MTSINRLANWTLRAMDSNSAWKGLDRYRPSDSLQDIPVHHALTIVLLTSVPFLLVGWIALLAVPDWAQEQVVLGVVIVTAFNVVLQFLGAMCWNWRATRLRGA